MLVCLLVALFGWFGIISLISLVQFHAPIEVLVLNKADRRQFFFHCLVSFSKQKTFAFIYFWSHLKDEKCFIIPENSADNTVSMDGTTYYRQSLSENNMHMWTSYIDIHRFIVNLELLFFIIFEKPFYIMLFFKHFQFVSKQS